MKKTNPTTAPKKANANPKATKKATPKATATPRTATPNNPLTKEEKDALTLARLTKTPTPHRVTKHSFDTFGDTITAENVGKIATVVTLQALETNYAKSGSPFIKSMRDSLVVDTLATINQTKEVLTDGFDLVQTATAFLVPFVGCKLSGTIDNPETIATIKANYERLIDGKTNIERANIYSDFSEVTKKLSKTDKNGKRFSVIRAVYGCIGNAIERERTQTAKQVYLENVNEWGKTSLVAVPFGWDIPTASDLLEIKAKIKEMSLNPRQKKVLYLRFKGLSVHAIAKKLGIDRNNLNRVFHQIQEKAERVGLFDKGANV